MNKPQYKQIETIQSHDYDIIAPVYVLHGYRGVFDNYELERHRNFEWVGDNDTYLEQPVANVTQRRFFSHISCRHSSAGLS